MKHIVFVLTLLGILSATSVQAQILFTGDTSGERNGSVYLFGTVSNTDGVLSSNDYGDMVLGLTNHVDLVVGVGDMTAQKVNAPYATAGFVLGLPTQKMGFSAMVFPALSIPMTTRNSSTAIANLAVVVSKNFKAGSHTLAPYTGYLGTYGMGPTDRILSAPAVLNQLPVGVYFTLSEKWGFTAEYDFGKISSVGVALNRGFKY